MPQSNCAGQGCCIKLARSGNMGLHQRCTKFNGLHFVFFTTGCGESALLLEQRIHFVPDQRQYLHHSAAHVPFPVQAFQVALEQVSVVMLTKREKITVKIQRFIIEHTVQDLHNTIM